MKTLFVGCLFALCFFCANSQTTTIPDANFEQFLVDQGIDSNGLNGNILNADAQAVTALNISINTITDFTGLEAFVNLVTLDAGTNQFATLPLTTLSLLEELVFNQNMVLASLDLSGNPNLKRFQARANGGSNSGPITVIDLSNNLQLEDINIYNFRNLQNVIFPDTNTVISIYLLMHNDITVDFSGYSSLESLSLSTNFNNNYPITATLPSEQNTLKTVAIQGGNIIDVDLSNFLALEAISLQSTNTETIDIPQTSTLTAISISDHNIASASFADASMLQNLTITRKQESPGLQLDITQNEALTTLNASHNYMDALDLSQNTNLSDLRLAHNSFATLETSQNLNLVYLDASYNLISSLDLSTNTILERLILNNNELPGIDLQANILLENLNLGTNKIPTLDVSSNNELRMLYIDDNLFANTGLDLTQNPELHYLDASNNQIESLDITQNGKLGSLILHHNLFSGTDIIDQYYDIWNANGALGASDELDVSYNLLSGRIPDFTNLAVDRRTNYFELRFNDNYFHFGDFEAEHLSYVDLLNTYWSSSPSLVLFRAYTYAPQAKVNEVETIAPNAGENITLTTTVRGNQNHYKWFKDGIELADAPDAPELILTDVNDCDSGIYHSEITSDLVPFENSNAPGSGGKNLLLQRNDITVNVTVNKTCVSLTNPVNTATDVAINTGIAWENTNGACGYILSVGTSSGGVDLVNNLDVGDLELYNFENDLPANQDIYVTIIPYFSDGEISGCTEEMFTTSTLAIPPDCTQLGRPLYGAQEVALTSDLYWEPANAADNYIVQVGTSSGTDNVLNQTVASTYYEVPEGTFEAGTEYFVTIIPTNTFGNATGCTETSFTTETLITPPACTTLMSPADGATDVALDVELSWNASAEATGYLLNVGTSSGGTQIIDNLDVGNQTVYNLTENLPENTEIFVSIIPYNSTGNATGCTEASFTTETLITPPACTTLTSPVDGAIDVALDVELSWNASAEATGYLLNVGTSSGGTQIIDNLDVGNQTVYNLTENLPENTEIFVSIIPYNSAGNASGCTEASFTTETLITPPACTTLTSPVNGATDVALDVELSWNPSAEATGYLLNVGTSSGGTQIIDNLDVGNQTVYNHTDDLPENTEIFVSIIPYNSAGNATGCTEASFTTDTLITAPACTTLTSPVDGAIDVALDATISWAPADSAAGYIINAGTSSGLSNIANQVDVGNTLTFDYALEFFNDQTIYVTITPYNEAGETLGCSEESFSTVSAIDPPPCTTLSNPSPNANGAFINTSFSWLPVSEASGYYLSIGTNPDATSYIDAFDVGNSTTYYLQDNLPYDTRIYVKITPYNNGGKATSCEIFSFITQAEPLPPLCTELLNPVPESADNPTDLRFNWASVENVTGYILNIGSNPNTQDIVSNLDVGNITSYTLNDLLPEETVLYISITPYNTNGTASNCEQFYFTTATAEETAIFDKKYGFSPDGDGINESWFIPNITDHPDNLVQIFNRWGDLVFEMENYDNATHSFTGIANRKVNFGAGKLPEGTYFFRIILTGTNNQPPAEGFLVLKR
ncbi:T9SS type B sorting domain-containing protein [Leeuwenhoekiella palythoae]|uniref:Gliding motility-associated C-terminal domain-containing protein n=1 Tax=Leeuwenhoekiella palythoae TaxID=573501 RepID=A0A1M5ZNT3_9FLAO|nr:gliding motility-associated C-terminal domain-containing protein [Leeuwenhoekiella palythoae]RXG27299.1 gliding motility-associated-like protein [Leeuwenhoekiella palythoae]SHI25947.1 gliding motility-associated C-terminal domain-containing protein [Leeuwenhoekiella palythoae]